MANGASVALVCMLSMQYAFSLRVQWAVFSIFEMVEELCRRQHRKGCDWGLPHSTETSVLGRK